MWEPGLVTIVKQQLPAQLVQTTSHVLMVELPLEPELTVNALVLIPIQVPTAGRVIVLNLKMVLYVKTKVQL